MATDALDATDPVARAAAAVAVGLDGAATRAVLARLDTLVDDPDARVRAGALGALVRAGGARRARDAWRRSVHDADAGVRRRAAELAPALGRPAPVAKLVSLLRDGDPGVAEAAAWALGELDSSARHGGGVPALASVARAHPDPLVREAAVAALGALGDPRGLEAILAACDDKPAVRRRAVLALAPFDGPDVDAALARARDDRDWQVRQAAEDLS
jgi:HEAT repeat protein